MHYGKWLWDEIFFIAYHMNQQIDVIKGQLSPLERKFMISAFVEQKEKEHKELSKRRK